ncbi:MAG: endonuclease/exonuclease/phosphatase family protein, partial [Phycisphaerales bacterium]
MFREEDADILILVELDQTWHDRLQSVAANYPHQTETVLPDGLGLGVWSKLPIKVSEIRHIVSDLRPSIYTTIALGEHDIRLVAIHPTPPALPVEGEDKRYGSRIRDAELMLLAADIEDRPDANWIVAGDFNDVAWSRTTALFTDVSGLADPRIGRGLVNTYHARYMLMRYPLDHVFVAEDFAVESFRRVKAPGSDHFAVRLALQFRPTTKTADPVEESESEAAGEMVREGVEETDEHNEEANGPDSGTPEP